MVMTIALVIVSGIGFKAQRECNVCVPPIADTSAFDQLRALRSLGRYCR
jgi:hypothetical protein